MDTFESQTEKANQTSPTGLFACSTIGPAGLNLRRLEGVSDSERSEEEREPSAEIPNEVRDLLEAFCRSWRVGPECSLRRISRPECYSWFRKSACLH